MPLRFQPSLTFVSVYSRQWQINDFSNPNSFESFPLLSPSIFFFTAASLYFLLKNLSVPPFVPILLKV